MPLMKVTLNISPNRVLHCLSQRRERRTAERIRHVFLCRHRGHACLAKAAQEGLLAEKRTFPAAVAQVSVLTTRHLIRRPATELRLEPESPHPAQAVDVAARREAVLVVVLVEPRRAGVMPDHGCSPNSPNVSEHLLQRLVGVPLLEIASC
eukprot:2122433-Pyramimonas_sp.AAC.1